MVKYTPLDQPSPETECMLGEDEGILEKKERRPFWRNPLFFHGALIAFNLLVCLVYTSAFSSWVLSRVRGLHSEPVRSLIDFEPRKFELSSIFLPNGSVNTAKPGNFNGDPRPELEEAWKELIGHQAFRIPEDQLGQFTGEPDLIRLTDGSGYYATLAVFHGLHCINRLHHFIYRDVYYAGISDSDLLRLRSHTEHCLDWLRQAVQCSSDTTLLPLYWDNKQPLPVAKDAGNHQCVKWGPLQEWAEHNSFDPFTPGLLMHPVFGHPYGDENKGDKIGIIGRT